MKETKVLKTYDNLALANLEKDLLLQNGVECFLSDENIVQLYPMFSSPFGGIKLHVFEKDTALAEKILNDYYENIDK
ncbi:MAG: DUF2007 domain-containing protein [Paludibacteraceae bacterium]|nr:DUF2007 domain-containing protein [Paludibacteraceae bacterium]